MSLDDKIRETRKILDRYRISGTTEKVQLGFSGGKDSTATYLLLHELGVDFTPVFADTDNEHPWTVEYAQTLHEKITDGPAVRTVKKRPYTAKEWADRRERFAVNMRKPHTIRAGVRRGEIMPPFPEKIIQDALNVMHSTGNIFLDMCIFHTMFPLRRAQFCTQELKLEPAREQVIFPWLRNGHDVITVAGIRADESKKRASYVPFELDPLPDFKKYVPAEVCRYFPILSWTWEDVFAMHKRHGIEPNPLYKNGMGRVGCMPCIHATKPEIRKIHIRFPEQLERIKEWERIMARISRWVLYTGLDIGFLAGTTSTGGSTIDAKIEWSYTNHGQKEADLIASDLEAPACSSQYGLCE